MEFFDDILHRIAYATDASAYRAMPQAVAYPQGDDDLAWLLAEARRRGTCLIPRAGGTSLAGQVVGDGIVVDVSRYMNNIVEINPEARYARVQPGVILDELNAACRSYGLFFSPETSTSSRCCIGGMVGNNSCGSHSLVYGSTRHHVKSLRVMLADGTFETFAPVTVGELEERFGTEFWLNTGGSIVESVYAQLVRWAMDEATAGIFTTGFPDGRLRRRSCGYAVDEAVAGLLDGATPLRNRSIDICKLLVGSEGTLAFVTEITLELDPLPHPSVVLLCAHCNSLENSFRANLMALKHNPTAVELMDGYILELCKDNPAQQRNRFFVEGDPAAILVIELRGENLEQRVAAAEGDLIASGLAYCCTKVDANDMHRVWALRKAGLGVLSGMKGDAKPVGVIEDTAVAPEVLPEYMADISDMLAQLGLKCVYYGHIGTGELHLRPILNLKSPRDRQTFRRVAEETALLVKKHRGSLSGEHGDGRLRGEFIPLVYGDEAYTLFKELKACWDPDNLFNRSKIVNTEPMDSSLRFDGSSYKAEGWLADTCYNWKAAFDECTAPGATGAKSQFHALMCSIEQCNGAAECRKSNLAGGVVCPTYRVSNDEMWSTRARANVMRELLTHGLPEGNATGKSLGTSITKAEMEQLAAMLYDCLACKGCKGECPSNVDMTRLRSELLQQIYDRKGTPLRSWMVARMAAVEQLGHWVWPVYNFFAEWKVSSAVIKRIVSFTPQRDIPPLSHNTMRTLVRREARKREKLGTQANKKNRKVLLFADEFTNMQESELGLLFARLLMKLGYDVEIPRHVESGRAAMSKGCLHLAKRFAVKNVRMLSPLVSHDTPLVGIEPSCILSFRDEYPDLVPPAMRDEARALADNCLLYDEFFVREMEAGRITSADFVEASLEVWLHGHCHQKALVGVDATVKMLRLAAGVKVHVVPSGCCGMAGSFGYEAEHYKTSLEIGEMVLFPTLRKAAAQNGNMLDAAALLSEKQSVDLSANAADAVPMVVAAPGTSCRQQILDGTGIRAVHPLVVLNLLCRYSDTLV